MKKKKKLFTSCDCVQLLTGMPRLLRSDCGTENSHIAFIQPFLRRNHSDSFAGTESFRFGKSITNQVIADPENSLGSLT